MPCVDACGRRGAARRRERCSTLVAARSARSRSAPLSRSTRTGGARGALQRTGVGVRARPRTRGVARRPRHARAAGAAYGCVLLRSASHQRPPPQHSPGRRGAAGAPCGQGAQRNRLGRGVRGRRGARRASVSSGARKTLPHACVRSVPPRGRRPPRPEAALRAPRAPRTRRAHAPLPLRRACRRGARAASPPLLLLLEAWNWCAAFPPARIPKSGCEGSSVTPS